MFKKIADLGSGACLDSSLSTDKKIVAVSTVNGINLHDTKTLAKIKHMKIDASPETVALSPNNKIVAYSINNGRVFLLDLGTGLVKELFLENMDVPESEFAIPEAYRYWQMQRSVTKIKVISFSPDGKTLATGCHSSFGSIDLIGVKDQSELNKVLDSKPRYSIVIWDLTQIRIKFILDTDGEVSSLTFSPDSSWLVSIAGMSGLPKLWDLSSGKLKCEINHMDYMIRDVCFSPDNLYVGSRGAMEHAITSVQSGRLVSKYMFMGEGPDWLVNAVDLISENEEIRKRLSGYTPKIFSLAISPKNKYLASAGDQPRVNIWDIESTYLANTIEIAIEGDDSNRKFVDLSYSPDGMMLITVQTSVIMVWDLTTNSLLAKYSDVVGGCAQFSPDGKLLGIAGENLMLSVHKVEHGTIDDTALWSKDAFSDGSVINSFDKKYNLGFSPDGKHIVTGGYDGNIQVWNAYTGELLFKESFREKKFWSGKVEPEKIYNVSFLPDGKNILYKVAGKLFLLNCLTWAKREIESETRSFFFNNQFFSTPDGTKLIGSDLKIYNLENLQSVSEIFEDRIGWFTSIAISKDGKLFAAGGKDGIAHVWDLGKENLEELEW